MSDKKTARESDKGFSIGAKLVIIVFFIVLVSSGTITALVSFLGARDLRLLAENNNLKINRRLAADVENAFENIRAASVVFINVLSEAGINSTLGRRTARIFFEQNPHIAALVFTEQGQSRQLFTNDRFFASRQLDPNIANLWSAKHINTLARAGAGETIIYNDASYAAYLLTLFFPWHGEGAGVLFSSDSLRDSLIFDLNKSYLLNGEDDVLIHSNTALVRSGANFAARTFVRDMRLSPQRSLQSLYTDEDNVLFLKAFTKLNIGAAALITSIKYDRVFEGIIKTTRLNIYLAIVVLGFSIMLIWFFAKSISSPLKVLIAAARQIESGVFALDLKINKRDEIGLLTKIFQKMSRALGVFEKFTNKEIALLAMQGQIKPDGLSKCATVLFSGICGFRQVTENFTEEFKDKASEKIISWLNEYLCEMVECVEKTKGVTDKFIGDTLMAHWGAALTSGNPKQDALNCVLSALMMRAAVFKMNKFRKACGKENPPVVIGCGINTGIVSAGQIGSERRMEYTVIGEPVNLASKIEALNKVFGTDILISENTWTLIKNFIITEEMPALRIEGEKPIRIFAVVNLASNGKGPKTLDDVRKLLGITIEKRKDE